MAESGSESQPKDPLDECLESARWLDPTGLQRNRLEAQWDRLYAERVRFRRRLVRWTLAASILLMLSAGWGGWFLLNPGQHPVAPDADSAAPHLADDSGPTDREPSLLLRLGRAPTRYEEAIFAAAVHRKQKAGHDRQSQAVVRVLDRALNDPESDIAQLCKPLQPQRLVYEQWILRRIGSWKPAEQYAALEVLREIGSPRAIPVLDRLSRNPEFLSHAWPVALHLATARQLGNWAHSGSPSQQRDAIRSLILRDQDSSAMSHYLQLVAQPASRNLAIEVLQASPEPPVETLFTVLNEGTKEQRHAAGLVLGRLANPEITNRLTVIARNNAFPSEVMVALLHSSDQNAVQFLTSIQRDPFARTALQLARVEWELISYTATFPQTLEIY